MKIIVFFFISTGTFFFVFIFSDNHRVAETHCDFRINQIESFLNQPHVHLRGWIFLGLCRYVFNKVWNFFAMGASDFFKKKIRYSKMFLWQSLLGLAVFAWNCTHSAESDPSHSLGCLCISLQHIDFWELSEPLSTKNIGPLLIFFFPILKKLPGSLVGFKGSAMWLVSLVPAAWYGTGTCKMSKKT